jgi:hypothetical protein
MRKILNKMKKLKELKYLELFFDDEADQWFIGYPFNDEWTCLEQFHCDIVNGKDYFKRIIKGEKIWGYGNDFDLRKFKGLWSEMLYLSKNIDLFIEKHESKKD